ncbi:type II toxin-antitoxin system RelE/ParE family toxin [Limnoglobus roseus]|uniref:Type II toxin-antitoxin system RelE/ParE family toxin n=1 Tax=Limnoglobus roseus TaxID=2598579 RepID=A0A5C1A3M9_9BACT|nr:type II toxin-antitoxin system RelE/ParE family toxin [Limnoglobus roseus]QEL13190.1 type II toxin-antitoxin system RelE/ParE family toxin [Limnoglobus roseus]
MRLPIVFRPLAQAEYDISARFYEGQQVGLGVAFTMEVEAVLDTLSAKPDRFPVVRRDIREAPVDQFPFCIYYRVRLNRVIVLAVFHQSRDPVEWQSRN